MLSKSTTAKLLFSLYMTILKHVLFLSSAKYYLLGVTCLAFYNNTNFRCYSVVADSHLGTLNNFTRHHNVDLSFVYIKQLLAIREYTCKIFKNFPVLPYLNVHSDESFCRGLIQMTTWDSVPFTIALHLTIHLNAHLFFTTNIYWTQTSIICLLGLLIVCS